MRIPPAVGREERKKEKLAADFSSFSFLLPLSLLPGRALAGEDDLDALTTRMAMYSARCKWIRSKAEWMTQVMQENLVQ